MSNFEKTSSHSNNLAKNSRRSRNKLKSLLKRNCKFWTINLKSLRKSLKKRKRSWLSSQHRNYKMTSRRRFISQKLSRNWKIKMKRLRNWSLRLHRKLKKWKNKNLHSILQDSSKLKNTPTNQKNATDLKKKSSLSKIKLITLTLSNNMKATWTRIKRSNTCSDWRRRTTI